MTWTYDVDIDINKMNKSNIFFCKKGFECFFGHKDHKNIRPFCMVLIKMSAYRRNFDATKYISFFITDDKLLEKV